MSERRFQPPVQRRSFLTRVGLGATAFAAAFGGASTAEAETPGNARWQPTLHEIDDWMDKVPGKHRMVFDTTTPESLGMALLFSNNYYNANQTGYGLKDSDLAVIIVARHDSTPMAFNDAIWAKYGVPISKKNGFVDPKTKEAPTSNLYNASNYGDSLANRGNQIDAAAKRGLQFAVCQVATRAYARAIAMATNGDADKIFNELLANLVMNSHPVPAGIVAVNRAQERGYAFVRG